MEKQNLIMDDEMVMHETIANQVSISEQEDAVEAIDIPACQIEFLIDEAQVDAAPVGSLGYTGVIWWKSVLPPSYAGFVQESDTGHK